MSRLQHMWLARARAHRFRRGSPASQSSLGKARHDRELTQAAISGDWNRFDSAHICSQSAMEKQQPAAANVGPSRVMTEYGGKINLILIVLNLLLSWIGWFITFCGICAFQNYTNNTEMGSGLSAGDWWDIGNFPHISNGKVIRFEWFIMILQLVTLGVLTLAIISRCVHHSRLTLISFLAVTTALIVIAADQFNNIRGSRHGRQYKSSTDVFAGFVLCAIGNFGLLYLLGIEPYAAQGEPVKS
ncbi:hypothetical protein WJX74_000292 [Apatococcus lobatus]|uniref:Uncharacterized protein n=1 Tax=Apatococcus lobatus TaxID=904363 RepID=A0AAW1S8R3_9CHLO